MGAVPTISATAFPQQSAHVGRAVLVWFHRDTTDALPGTVRRDDREPPFETLLELADGRVLRGTECQYMFAETPRERWYVLWLLFRHHWRAL
jgi:hypothetical protein